MSRSESVKTSPFGGAMLDKTFQRAIYCASATNRPDVTAVSARSRYTRSDGQRPRGIMRRLFFRPVPHYWVTGILLVALGFRALIPAGFMPSATRPLTLEICRAGFLATLDDRTPAQHPPGSSQNDQCPFGAAPAAGPIAAASVLPPAGPAVALPTIRFETLHLGARVDRAHPARGPPRPA